MFPPGDICTNLGIGYRLASGRVTYVKHGGAGQQLGIEKDTCLQLIDGQKYTEALLMRKIDGRRDYEVKFGPKVATPDFDGLKEVLTAVIHSGPEGAGLHVSCTTCGGAERMTSDFSTNASISDLEAIIKQKLEWSNVTVFCSQGEPVSKERSLQQYTQLTLKTDKCAECRACQFELTRPGQDHMLRCTCGAKSGDDLPDGSNSFLSDDLPDTTDVLDPMA